MAFDFNNIEDNNIDKTIQFDYISTIFERDVIQTYGFSSDTTIPTDNVGYNITYRPIVNYDKALVLPVGLVNAPNGNRKLSYKLLNHPIFDMYPDYKVFVNTGGIHRVSSTQLDYHITNDSLISEFEQYIKACSHIVNFTMNRSGFGGIIRQETTLDKAAILNCVNVSSFLKEILNICKTYSDIVENVYLAPHVIETWNNLFYIGNFINKGYFDNIQKLMHLSKNSPKRCIRDYDLNSDIPNKSNDNIIMYNNCNSGTNRVTLGFYISLLVKYIKLARNERKENTTTD